MGWQAVTIMDQRLCFIAKYTVSFSVAIGHSTHRSLCVIPSDS